MRRSPLHLLLLLSLFAVAPLLAPGYFLDAHDARHSLFWLVEFDLALRDGFLWPRWAADHALGYGYPLFIFYAPLAFFVAEAFHLLGASIVGAVKLTWGLSLLLSGVTMYRFARRLWGAWPAFIAGLLYVYAPYHLVNIYVRAALAEFAAFALFPWVLHSFWDLLEEGGRRRLALAGLSFGLTLLTHSVTVIFFPPLLCALILYWLILRWRRHGTLPWRSASNALAGGLLGVGLAAIFLLPALAETGYIVQEQWVANTYNYAEQFVYPHQLLDAGWGFGHALAGPDDGLSQQIGLWLVILGLAALPFVPGRRPPHAGVLAGFLLAALASLFLTQSASRVIWDNAPFLTLIQFPFRLLAMANLLLALVSAGVVAALMPNAASKRNQAMAPVLVVLGLSIALASYAYTRPELTAVSERDQTRQAVYDFEVAYPDMRGTTAFAPGGPPLDSPKLAAYLAGEPFPLAGLIAGEGLVTPVHQGAGSEIVQVQASTDVTLQFYTYWYPGWRASVNGRRVDAYPAGAQGLITLDLPAGEHEVGIRFGNTPLRTAAATLSAASLLVLIALRFWPRRED